MRPSATQIYATLLMAAQLMPPPARASDVASWRAESSEQFRQGFVAGIASYLMNFPEGPGNAAIRAGYADCLAGETDGSVLDLVDGWLDRHPKAERYAPDIATQMALADVCARFMPRKPVQP